MKSKVAIGIACLVVAVTTYVHPAVASPSRKGLGAGVAPASRPEFWYVVAGTEPAVRSTAAVRGIVIPTSVSPTVETTPNGSVLVWRRADGTRQSIVVQGVSSFAFKPGPLDGTTYVPFGQRRHLQYDPDWDPKGCCACASWQDSQESVEALSCVIGCPGCGCEGCICSPTFPCPVGPESVMTLQPSDTVALTMTFDKGVTTSDIAVVNHGRPAAAFHGKRLAARVTSAGDPVITNPDTITLAGRLETNASVRSDSALFAWSSPDAAIILEQPNSMPAPVTRQGTIDLRLGPGTVTETLAARKIEPLKDRCTACGTHPNSDGDLEIYDCVPGFSVCYRCVSWECYSPER